MVVVSPVPEIPEPPESPIRRRLHPIETAGPEPISREELGALTRAGSVGHGWLVCSGEGEALAALDPAGVEVLRDLTAETLVSVGVDESDRVLIALNSEGAGTGVLWTQAASVTAGAAGSAGPRQGLRTASMIRGTGASVLVTTPSLATALAVRMRAAGSDPRQLRLRLLVLVGETADDGRRRRLGDDFDARVTEIWCDPVFGAGLAWRSPDSGSEFRLVRPAVVTPEPVEVTEPPRDGGALVEWVLQPDWVPALAGVGVRTGVVSRPGAWLGDPRWTVGDHVLVRGRWVSLGALDRCLKGLGADRWQLRVEAGTAREQLQLGYDAPIPIPVVEAALEAVCALRPRVAPQAVERDEPRLLDARLQHLGDRSP